MSEEITKLVAITSRIEQKLDTTHDWVKAHESKITAIEADLNKAKGGWFAMIGFTGLAGTIGGLISKYIGR